MVLAMVACLFLAGPVLLAQEFEVASVKRLPLVGDGARLIPKSSGGPGTGDPGLFRWEHCPLVSLLDIAFNLQRFQYQYSNPLLTANEYQVEARVPKGATMAEFRVMLQNLLKERFHLRYHFEKKLVEGFGLVAAKSGAKLTLTARQSPTQAADSIRWINTAGHVRLQGEAQSIDDLTHLLVMETASPIENASGIGGFYDFDVSWVQVPNVGTAELLRDALESQLGLKLIPRKVTVDLFVLDGVDATPTEN